MFRSMINIPDPHLSLMALSRPNLGFTASSGGARQAADARDSSDDDEFRLVIDVDAVLGMEEPPEVEPALGNREPSHLKRLLQTGIYTGGNCNNVYSGEPKEKNLQTKIEESFVKNHAPSADEIQKSLNSRADDYMRSNFMQYQVQVQAVNVVKPELSCDKCGRTFPYPSSLDRHKRQSHPDVKIYRCNVCHRKFLQLNAFMEHAKEHANAKPFACEQCQRQFAYKCNLTAHVKTHAGLKPYACDFCDARFSRKYILTAHRRTHSGERFACDLCELKYANRANLIDHRRTHGDMYVCKTCGKRFSRKFILTQHARTHSPPKPFPCQTCGKKFTRNSTLKAHARIHQPNSFACSICFQTFATLQYLKLHMEKHDTSEVAQTYVRVADSALMRNKMVQTDE